MQRQIIWFLLCLGAVALMTSKTVCAKEMMAKKESVQLQPLRILLEDGSGKFEFHIQGAFQFQDLQGKTLLKRTADQDCWMARVLSSVPAIIRHSVLVASFASKANATALQKTLRSDGYSTEIEMIGLTSIHEDLTNASSTRYRVLVGDFPNIEDAQALMAFFRNAYRPRLVERRLEPPHGVVEFANADFSQLMEMDQGFRVCLTRKSSSLTLHRLTTESRGMGASAPEDRRFEGIIEFRIDNSGQLAVINEIQLDAYLKGVLPVEMDAAFPLDAHKAQAVAARGTVLSMLGMKHRTEDWDFCAGSHCQQFAGLTNQVDICNEAVQSTSGEYLLWRNRICDSVYHSCCGGHTENKEFIWMTPPEDVLTGRPDGTRYRRQKFSMHLSEDEDLRSWLLDPPEWCECRVQDADHPVLSTRSMHNFRWREVVYRQDLEALIREKTELDPGTIYALTPLKRGNSGRIIELEVIGSRRNIRLQKELIIRRALSEDLLFSSAFIIQSELDDDGLPIFFTFIGAGRGHGVGMCQIGAAGMAIKGIDYQSILANYYPGTRLGNLHQESDSSDASD
jgi:stage II sporulation protein D